MIILFGKRFLSKEFYFTNPLSFLKESNRTLLAASLLLYYRGKNEKEYENVLKKFIMWQSMPQIIKQLKILCRKVGL